MGGVWSSLALLSRDVGRLVLRAPRLSRFRQTLAADELFMRSVRLALLGAVALPMIAQGQTAARAPDPVDPHVWLEEVSSPRAMAWVERQNTASTKRLEADPRYARNYAEALEIAGAKDRIPQPGFVHGEIYNFWQDPEHLRGIWRKTTLADYTAVEPHWTTVLDIDALNKAEGKSWVFKGAELLKPEETRCMIQLSDGGEDAADRKSVV